ncbi:cytochrome b [Methylocella silvestris]|uniref:Cytochrome B n=1 Tax=Methylocella silvestris TaxID=199596 RepID=A0A2J7TEX8_METSI|nr:cytochrome b [Methylocella silvestris]PNG25324.1 cytochrome B [Methylocella silvestris]
MTDRAKFDADSLSGVYPPVLQALHWITALLVFAILPVAWVMIALPRESPWVGTMFMIHKSLGVTIFALAVVRLFWRAIEPPPPLPWSLEPWEALAAKISHALLYVILLAMPVSGFILSAASNHPVVYFNLFTLPALPENKPLAEAAEKLHVAGQWAVYAFVGLHILGTAWHLIVKRDAILDRMTPPQVNAD